MKKKDWTIPFTRPAVPHELLSAGFTPLLSMVLALRGIRTAAEAQTLISGGEELLCDPMLMLDMDKARERILRAIRDGETVAVYGDYDVDGITSTCLVTDYLRRKGIKCVPYIPDRNEEGYGLNCAALDTLKAQGVSLVITVDCGITAVEEAEHAAQIGVDMVITDHHECRPDALPEVTALVDCKRDGDTYPNKNLAGVGVALKLVCACEGESSKMLEMYGDLAAIGTVADVMPLTGENRFLVRYGLSRIAKAPRPGIAAMFRESGTDARHLTASTIGFSLAPRLNAAGRLGQASVAARLLMSQDENEAAALAKELCELNRQRQSIETQIWQEANDIIKDSDPQEPIVLASDRWHQGVIGIAASRLAEQYSLPAIIICLNGENGKGSCRSTGSFNLFEALSACSDCLEGFGGHAMAAGVTVRRGCVDELRSRLREYYLSHPDRTLPALEADLLVDSPELLTMACVESLDELEPCGNGNPRPLLYMENVSLDSVQPIGGGKHLRLKLAKFGQTYDGVFFSQTVPALGARAGQRCDIVFAPQINEFHGRRSVQLVITDLRRSKEG